MRKLLLYSILFLALALSVSAFQTSPDGNTVFINNSAFSISASPATLVGSGYVNIMADSKLMSVEANMIVGFNTSFNKPVSLEVWNPHNVTKSYTCPTNQSATYNSTYFTCGNTTHYYDSLNLASRTAYWNILKNYTIVNVKPIILNYDYDGKNRWYIIPNITISGVKKGRILIDSKSLDLGQVQPKDYNGKYDVAFYPSSYGTTLNSINNAISANKLFLLDPTVNLTNGLIGSWWMENTSFIDGSPCGTNVVLSGSTTILSGVIGNGSRIGSADTNNIRNLSMASPSSCTPQGNFNYTMAGWVYLTSYVSYTDKPVIWYGGESAYGVASYEVWANGGNYYFGSIHYTDELHFTSYTIPLTTWVYGTIVYYTNKTEILYVNGVEKQDLQHTNNLNIGTNEIALQSDTQSTRNDRGVMEVDELVFYNRALNASEVSYLYNESNSGNHIPITPSSNQNISQVNYNISSNSINVSQGVSLSVWPVPSDASNVTYQISWGDGSTNATGNASHPYGTAGTYDINITATDGQGNSVINSTSVTVSNINLTGVNLVTNGTSGPENYTINYSVSTVPSNPTPTISWQVSWGDGSSNSTSSSGTHTYTVPGDYNLTACASQNSTGITECNSTNITVYDLNPVVTRFELTPHLVPSNPNATATYIAFYVLYNFTSYNNSNTTVLILIKNAATGTTCSGPLGPYYNQTPNTLYNYSIQRQACSLDPGNKFYALLSLDYGVSTANTSNNVTVSDAIPPTYANSSYSQNINGTPTVFSIDFSDYSLDSYILSFDNGTGIFVNDSPISMGGALNYQANVTKILNNTVGTLIQWRWYVNDTSGNTNTTPVYNLTTTAIIQNITSETLTTNTKSGNEPLDIAWNVGVTPSNSTGTISYQTSFGDGSANSTASNGIHTYNNGTYNLSSCATQSDSGLTLCNSTTITVNNVPITSVSFSFNQSYQNMTLPIGYSCSATGGNTPYTYQIAFGDATSNSTSASSTHTYSTNGTYTATCTVTDNDGDYLSNTSTINITYYNASATYFNTTGTLLTDYKDSYVFSYLPNTNYGTAGNLYTWMAGATDSSGIYIAFNTTNLTNVTVGEAYLVLKDAGTDSTFGSSQVAIYNQSNDSWTETNITWNNQPCGNSTSSYFSDCSKTLQATQFTNNGATYRIPITELIKYWTPGTPLNLFIKDTGYGANSVFYSRQSGFSPYIQVIPLTRVDINVYYEENLSLFNKPVTIKFIDRQNDTSPSINTLTTSNGTISTLGTPSGSYDILYNATNYITRWYYVTVPSSNTTIVDLYMRQANTGNSTAITVNNAYGQIQTGAIIKAQRYYNYTGWITVDQIQTGIDGIGTLNLKPYYTYYKFLVQQNNSTKLETSRTLITNSALLNGITLNYQTSGTLFPGYINYNNLNLRMSVENYTNGTKYFKATYNDVTGATHTYQLVIYRQNGYTSTQLAQANSTSSSGTITINVPNSTGDYYATFYEHSSPTPIDVISTIISSAPGIFGTGGIFLGILLMIGVAGVGAFSLTGAIILGVLSIIIMSVFGLVLVPITGIVTIIIIGGIILLKRS